MSDTTHALLSPSSAARWLRCAGSVALEAPLPDSSSEFADEGTAAHELAGWCLTEGKDTVAYFGRVIVIPARSHHSPRREFTVDNEMASFVQTYVDNIRQRIAAYRLAGARSVELHVEQKVPIGHLTGEEGGAGTADAVIIVEFPDGTALLDVNDLKYGRGVEVVAESNEQLQTYALGAHRKFELVADFTRVRVSIHQPRLRTEPSDWELSIEELQAFGRRLSAGARQALEAHTLGDAAVRAEYGVWLEPGEKQCRFCKAKATCPAIEQHVLNTVADDFVDVTKDIARQLGGAKERVQYADNAHLASLMPNLDLIEQWCKAVRAKAESELLAGHEVPGYKLVRGRKGARAWADATAAEEALKAMRLKADDMYTRVVISPTKAEELLKESPRRWTKLIALITQSEGSLSVAPMSDKRAAVEIQPAADDFDDVSTQAAAEALV